MFLLLLTSEYSLRQIPKTEVVTEVVVSCTSTHFCLEQRFDFVLYSNSDNGKQVFFKLLSLFQEKKIQNLLVRSSICFTIIGEVHETKYFMQSRWGSLGPTLEIDKIY